MTFTRYMTFNYSLFLFSFLFYLLLPMVWAQHVDLLLVSILWRKINSRCSNHIYFFAVWKFTFISILMLTRVIIYIHNNISLLSYIFKTDDITMDTTAAIEEFELGSFWGQKATDD